MKVALVVPPVLRFTQQYYKNQPQMNIGYIAGGLKKNKVNVTVYNSKQLNLSENELGAILIKNSYDIVGFSAMTFEIKSIGRIANRLKFNNKNCLIAVGGCHVNAIPKETMLEFPDFDIACIGEHEDQIASILMLLYSGDYSTLEKYNHIIFRRGNDLFYKNLNRRLITNLDALPWPAYDLFGSKELDPGYLTSRGCPFTCLFCQQNSGRIIRTRNPIDICDEIEFFSKYFKQKNLVIKDEVFTANKQHVIGICNEIIKRGLHVKINWRCITHTMLADQTLLYLMKEAGCNGIGFGIESGSAMILEEIDKRTNKEFIITAVNAAKKAKIPVFGMFMLGHPYETKKTMMETISFALKLELNSISLSMMTPYPGTKAYEYASNNKAGLTLLTKNWERYDNYAGSALAWDNFSINTLKIMQFCGLVLFYLYNLRFVQFVKFVKARLREIFTWFSYLSPSNE